MPAPRSRSAAPTASATGRASATELEISGLCSAARTGESVACGAERAFESARSCIAADEAIAQQSKLTI